MTIKHLKENVACHPESRSNSTWHAIGWRLWSSLSRSGINLPLQWLAEPHRAEIRKNANVSWWCSCANADLTVCYCILRYIWLKQAVPRVFTGVKSITRHKYWFILAAYIFPIKKIPPFIHLPNQKLNFSSVLLHVMLDYSKLHEKTFQCI